jgi:branched-chain amino acid aminotransferase
MNIFFVRKGILITPPLTDTLLAGITRDSVIQVAQDMGLEVSEEELPLQRIIEEIKSGEITEAIACGTAAVVTGIRTFHFEDGSVVQVGYESPGPITSQLYERLVSIQYSAYPDEHGWVWPVCDVGIASTSAIPTHI